MAMTRWTRRRAEITRLIVRRVAVAVPVLLATSLGVFFLAALSPFDPLAGYLGDRYERIGSDQAETLRGALDLDTPWWQAWLQWAGRLVTGDLGQSRVFGQPVAEVVAERLPWTLLLSGTALVLAVAIGLAVGCVAGLRPGSTLDRAVAAVAVVLQAVPPYVLSLGAIAVFALGLHWLPTGGAAPPGVAPSAGTLLRHLLLPGLVLCVSLLPWMILTVRASVSASLASEPVRSAVARGLSPRTVVRGHVLPVSLAPLVTLIGARLPELVVGAVIVEEIFTWPGLAGALVAAAQQLDFGLLAFCTLATSAVVLLGSLLADVTYLMLDPTVTADG